MRHPQLIIQVSVVFLNLSELLLKHLLLLRVELVLLGEVVGLLLQLQNDFLLFAVLTIEGPNLILIRMDLLPRLLPHTFDRVLPFMMLA